VKAAPEAVAAPDPTYEFTLVIEADAATDEMVDRLYEAGCDDATIGRQHGQTIAMFDRVAKTYGDAIASAVKDVQKAGYSVARVVADDMLTQADIARKTGMSRQMISLLVAGKRGPGGFPAPEVCESTERPLWRLNKVADWFRRNGLSDALMANDAETVEAVNNTLGFMRSLRANPGLLDVVKGLFDDFTIARKSKKKATS
jgi:hypothetical protein